MNYTAGCNIRHNVYHPGSLGWKYGAGIPIRRFSYDGVPIQGGMANDDICVILERILDELKAAGYRLRPDADEWGYSNRPIRGGTTPSFHSAGIAADLDASENPFTQGPAPHTIPDVLSGICRKYGWQWGGDWSGKKDYMHVEFHGSPADARVIADRIRAEGPNPPKEEEEEGQEMILYQEFEPGAMTKPEEGIYARKALQFPTVGRSLTVDRAFLHYSGSWVPDMEHMPKVQIWVIDGYVKEHAKKYLYITTVLLNDATMGEFELPEGANKVVVEVLNSPPGAVVSFDVELIK